MADLLSTNSAQGQAEELEPIIADAAEGPIPFWIGEGNSCSCGGMPNVSDTFGAALWSLDFLPEVAKAGTIGMNFHGW